MGEILKAIYKCERVREGEGRVKRNFERCRRSEKKGNSGRKDGG